MKILPDSSVWLEIIFNGLKAQACSDAISRAQYVVPTTVLFEVYRKVEKLTSIPAALEIMGSLSKGEVLDLDRETAILAAELSNRHQLGMADSYILAHARQSGSKLVTLDHDFSSIPDVTVLR